MRRDYLFIGIFFLFLVSFANAKDCGGNITCECGDKLVNNYILSSDLTCSGDGLIIGSNIELNCNSHKITGSGIGTGVNIWGYATNSIIKNCDISNFNDGIKSTTYAYKYCSSGFGGCVWKWAYVTPNYYKVYNNHIHDNIVGYNNAVGVGYEIYNNTFSNNTNFGLKIYSHGSIWENTFSDKGIFLQYSSLGNYCINGTGNVYQNGALGPTCTCYAPISGMIINSNITLCSGEYNLIGSIGMTNGGVMNCNNVSLIGKKDIVAISIPAENIYTPNYEINGCKFENFSSGVNAYTTSVTNCASFSCYTTYFHPKNIKIKNSEFINNLYGIQISNGWGHNYSNNSFINNSISGLKINDAQGNFYGNYFFNNNFHYTSTAGKDFCGDSENEYFGNVTIGPKCGCFVPYDGLNINSNATLCSGSYKLLSSITLNYNAILNCNNTELIGNHAINGIQIPATNPSSTYILVNSCTFKNFSSAIMAYTTSVTNCASFSCYTTYFYPNNINIKNSSFSNNLKGLDLQSGYNYEVSQNYFSNNSNFGLNLGNVNGYFWNNIFADTGINYQTTSANIFCKNNLSNMYFGDLKGPLCDCLTPVNNLQINSNVTFCKGIYNLSQALTLASSNLNISCGNSILVGNKNINAFNLGSYSNLNLSNCLFTNYYSGAHTSSSAYSNNILLDNISFLNTNYGFINYYGQNVKIKNSNFLGIAYNTIYNYYNQPINVTNNWWGTTNETQIESKFYGQNIEYKPYKLEGPKSDLTLDSKDISVIGNKIILNIKNNGEIFVSGFKIKLYDIKDGEYLDEKEFILNQSIYAGFSQKYTLDWNLEGDSLGVLLDSDNQIEELDELNNFAIKGDITLPTYYLDILLLDKFAEAEIKNFLKENLGKDLETTTKNNADYTIKINEFENTNFQDYLTQLNLSLDLTTSLNSIPKPYEAIILSQNKTIQILAKGIQGYIVGARELIKNYETYLLFSNFLHIDAKNLGAIQVYDYLKFTGNNQLSYRNALNDNMYKQIQGTISVTSPEGTINYRYRHLEPLKSDILKAYIDKDGYPVVMAGGLYSNIEEWKDFGQELSNEGFDIYLIELTGGPEAEQDIAYDYTYDYLYTQVLPNYVDFITEDSQSSKIKYVGHSNGCRVGLSYFNNTQNLVDTFVGLACPTRLNDISGTVSIEREIKDKNINLSNGVYAINILKEATNKHIFRSDFAILMKKRAILDTNPNKISLNLQEFYMNLGQKLDDKFLISSFAKNYIFIAGNGTYPLIYGIPHFDDDGAVPISDMKDLSSSLNQNLILKQNLNHGELVSDISVQNIVGEGLK